VRWRFALVVNPHADVWLQSSDDNGTEATDDGIDTTKSLGGCINVNGAISVNAGAEGSFFGEPLLFSSSPAYILTPLLF
jgi:hypothetical protein